MSSSFSAHESTFDADTDLAHSYATDSSNANPSSHDGHSLHDSYPPEGTPLEYDRSHAHVPKVGTILVLDRNTRVQVEHEVLPYLNIIHPEQPPHPEDEGLPNEPEAQPGPTVPGSPLQVAQPGPAKPSISLKLYESFLKQFPLRRSERFFVLICNVLAEPTVEEPWFTCVVNILGGWCLGPGSDWMFDESNPLFQWQEPPPRYGLHNLLPDSITRVLRIRCYPDDHQTFKDVQQVVPRKDYLGTCRLLCRRANRLLVETSKGKGSYVEDIAKKAATQDPLYERHPYGRPSSNERYKDMDRREREHLELFWKWLKTRNTLEAIHAGLGAEFPIMDVVPRYDGFPRFGQYNVGFYVCEMYALRRHIATLFNEQRLLGWEMFDLNTFLRERMHSAWRSLNLTFDEHPGIPTPIVEFNENTAAERPVTETSTGTSFVPRAVRAVVRGITKFVAIISEMDMEEDDGGKPSGPEVPAEKSFGSRAWLESPESQGKVEF